MAHERNSRQRRLIALRFILILFVATLVLSGLIGCGESTRTGWFGPDPIASVTLTAEHQELTVEVELPAGYEPAEDFVQRAGLRMGESVRTDEQPGLDRPFRLTLPHVDGSLETADATIELVLGFCEPDAKDVCYIDTARLPVTFTSTGVATPRSILYRPESPQ